MWSLTYHWFLHASGSSSVNVMCDQEIGIRTSMELGDIKEVGAVDCNVWGKVFKAPLAASFPRQMSAGKGHFFQHNCSAGERHKPLQLLPQHQSWSHSFSPMVIIFICKNSCSRASDIFLFYLCEKKYIDIIQIIWKVFKTITKSNSVIQSALWVCTSPLHLQTCTGLPVPAQSRIGVPERLVTCLM